MYGTMKLSPTNDVSCHDKTLMKCYEVFLSEIIIRTTECSVDYFMKYLVKLN